MQRVACSQLNLRKEILKNTSSESSSVKSIEESLNSVCEVSAVINEGKREADYISILKDMENRLTFEGEKFEIIRLNRKIEKQGLLTKVGI